MGIESPSGNAYLGQDSELEKESEALLALW